MILTMALIAAINVYSDAWTLPRCIESIRRAAPQARVVVVDGAYAAFPHPAGQPESADGTLDIAERLADTVIRCPRDADGRPQPWPDEIVKRNAYLVGQPGDFYLVVDADESVEGRVPVGLFAPAQDVLLQRDDGTPRYGLLRLFAHAPGIRYEGAHNAIWIEHRLLNQWPRQVAAGFSLRHHYSERGRDVDRIARKGRYYDALAHAENGWRKTHAMV